MSEKVFLRYRTGVWIQIIGCLQITLCSLQAIFQTYRLISILRTEYLYRQNRISQESVDLEIKHDISVIPLELEKSGQNAYSFDFLVVVLIEFFLFTIGYVFATTMGVILLKGYKQRSIHYLKMWLVFSIVSILWHAAFMAIMDGSPFGLIEMIVFGFVYLFGMGIVYKHINTVQVDLNTDEEELPKYESMGDECL